MRGVGGVGVATLALGALGLSWAALGAGCEETQTPRRPRGITPQEATSRSAPLPATSEPAPTPAPRSALPSPFRTGAPDPGALARPGGSSVDAAVRADAAPMRDLASELIPLLGAPASCLDLPTVARTGGRITVRVTAYVVPSGRITRASAEAPGQPETALRCLEQRVVAGSLRPPIAGAPKQVTLTLPLEVVAEPTPP